MLKSRSPLVAVSLVLALSAAGSAHADDKSDIKSVYNRLGSAMKAKNADKVASLLAPNFTQNMKGGRSMSLKQALSQMKMEFQSIKSFDKFDITLTSINVSGKNANVNTSYTMKGTTMPMGKDKKSHVLAGTGTTTDKLVKTSGGWKFLSTTDVSQKMTMDGKPISG